MNGQLVKTAFRWRTHLLACGSRIHVDAKLAEALRFLNDVGARSFAVPTKLVGVREHRQTLRAISQEPNLGRWERLILVATTHDGTDAIDAYWHGAPVGQLQRKHVRWLLPLLGTGKVRCHVLQITGLDQHTHGCNVALSGLADALDVYERYRDYDQQAAPIAA